MKNQRFSLSSKRIVSDDGKLVRIEETYTPDPNGNMVLFNANPGAVTVRETYWEASQKPQQGSF